MAKRKKEQKLVEEPIIENIIEEQDVVEEVVNTLVEEIIEDEKVAEIVKDEIIENSNQKSQAKRSVTTLAQFLY